MRASGAILLLLLPACAPAGAPPVPLYEVVRGPFVRQVTAEGNLTAVRATPLVVPSASRGGFQIAWVAEDGTPVSAGEVVIRFDPTELEKTLEDARADRDIVGHRTVRERAAGEVAVSNLERDAELARIELDKLQSFQKRDEEIFSRFEIVQSAIDSELAAARELHARESREGRDELNRAQLDMLAIERRIAAMKIDQARSALAALEVRAPHDGLLILERDWLGTPSRAGDTVFTGQKLAEIPDLTTMQGEVWVLEADAGGLAIGQRARVVVESRPGEIFGARVARVDSLARPRVVGSPVQYFGVTLELERTEPAIMKPGQRITAEIVMDELDEVVAVPRQAVFEVQGRSVAYRRQGSGFLPAPVTLGPAGLARVVVLEGLSAGDVIALADPRRPTRQRAVETIGAPLPGGPGEAP